MKKCNKCLLSFDLNFFGKKSCSSDGIDNVCKGCKKIANNEYYEKNRNKKLLYQNEYKVKNYSKIKEYNKEYSKKYKPIYFQLNKEKRLEYDRKYYNLNKKKTKIKDKAKRKERYNIDIIYKLKCLVKNRIKETITKQGGSRKNNIFEYLKCDIIFFKQYIESKFYPEMNWSNHGEIWELDHIEQCFMFDLSDIEEQQKCFHYLNYQPLFKTTEIAKNFGYNNIIGNRNKPKRKKHE